MSKINLKHYIPKSVLCLKEGYSLSLLKGDLIAGITVGVIAFPLAMAYAIGAGISPERGLFTAIIAGFLISLLGGSRVQIGGPTGTMIVVLFEIIGAHGLDGMILASLIAGVILILFGFIGVGTYIKYIPYPVVTGLSTGIALVIFSSQLKDFFGLKVDSVPVDFLGKCQAFFEHVATWNIQAFAIGLGALGIMIYVRRYKPQFPGAPLALAIASFVATYFHIDVQTIGDHFGTLPFSLPAPALPDITATRIMTLLPDGLTIALLISIESLLSATVSEGMTGWRYQSNCELVAQGIANISASLFGGIPAAGALARTAANVKSGAKTPLAGMIHASVIFCILFFFSSYIALIPLPALAAVLIMIAWNMSELHHFFHLFTAPKRDIVVLLAVFFFVVFTNITVAVQIGMILAAFLFMKQMSDLSDVISSAPLIDKEEENGNGNQELASRKGVEIFEINGPFFFGVADRLKNLMNEFERPPSIFILRMRKVPTIDASGMHALEEFFLECNRQKTLLLLSEVKKNPLKDLKRYHLEELIGEDHIFSTIGEALTFAENTIEQTRAYKSEEIFI